MTHNKSYICSFSKNWKFQHYI